MEPPKIESKSKKEELFEAIAPQQQGPIMIATKQSQSGRGGKFGVFSFLLFLAAAAGLAYTVIQYEEVKHQLVLERQTEKTVEGAGLESVVTGGTVAEKIARLMILPGDEDPSVATVQTLDELNRIRAWYSNAKYGDSVLTFKDRIVVYDPTVDKIGSVLLLNTQVAGSATAATGVPTSSQGPVALDIRNGAGVAGLAGRTAESFNGKPGFSVASVGNAANGNYQKTVIVNLKGKDVSALEQQYGVSAVTVLPAGESSTNADVVVILGRS